MNIILNSNNKKQCIILFMIICCLLQTLPTTYSLSLKSKCRNAHKKSCRRHDRMNQDVRNVQAQIKALKATLNSYYDDADFMNICLDLIADVDDEASFNAFKRKTSTNAMACEKAYFSFAYDYQRLDSKVLWLFNKVKSCKKTQIYQKETRFNSDVARHETTLIALKNKIKSNKCANCRKITGLDNKILGLVGTSKSEIKRKATNVYTKMGKTILKFINRWACQLVALTFPIAGAGIDVLLATLPPFNAYVIAMQSVPVCHGFIADDWSLQLPGLLIGVSNVASALATVICAVAAQPGLKDLQPVCLIATAVTLLAKAVISAVCGRGGTAVATVLQVAVMCHVKINGKECGKVLNYPCFIFEFVDEVAGITTVGNDDTKARYSRSLQASPQARLKYSVKDIQDALSKVELKDEYRRLAELIDYGGLTTEMNNQIAKTVRHSKIEM